MDWTGALTDVLWPDACPRCEGPGGVTGRTLLCETCDGAVPRTLRSVPASEPLAAAWALGPYEGALGALARRGKYRPDPRAVREMADRLGAAVALGRERLGSVDLVTHVPVPLRRRLVRGFDQGELLACEVARRLGVPRRALLRRVRPDEQAGRPEHERRRLARGAFAARSGVVVPAGVILVDDVMTTGATAASCASELLSAGASRVALVCVASRAA